MKCAEKEPAEIESLRLALKESIVKKVAQCEWHMCPVFACEAAAAAD